MPDLAILPVASKCPDKNCAAPIGRKHLPGCEVAICVMTGRQRLLHQLDPPPDLPTAVDLPFLDITTHTCGEDVWTGRHHGVEECYEQGLFVRRAEPIDHPFTGWIPCSSDHPGAVPDLDRLARHAVWSATAQIWELPKARAGRG